MDITTSPRDTGIYAIREVGMQRWPEGDQTWQAPGVRVTLMNGRSPLAEIKLEVAASKAEQLAQDVVDGITPWVKTVAALVIVRRLRDDLEMLERLTVSVEDGERWGSLIDDDRASMQRYADMAGLPAGLTGSQVCREAAVYLSGQIARGQRLALAHAPDPSTAAIHRAWTLPSELLLQPEQWLAPAVAADLLAGWASAREMRDGLITWAVRDAETSRSEVQRITGVSRSTINRLLPES